MPWTGLGRLVGPKGNWKQCPVLPWWFQGSDLTGAGRNARDTDHLSER